MSNIFLITGASGKLGAKVVAQLLAHGVKPSSIAVLVRSEEKGEPFKSKGIQVKIGDYDDVQSLKNALQGITRALLISGNELGAKRLKQHLNFIQAAKEESTLSLIAYTSILNADASKMILAQDHKATEVDVVKSGIPYSILRNGWYIENTAAQIGMWSKTGTIPSATGQGVISAASINDYAEAAAKVLLLTESPKNIYELGGSSTYTLDKLAALASEVLDKPIKAVHMSKEEYTTMLSSLVPVHFAEVIADAEDNASKGALFDTSGDLEALLGRPTEPIIQVMKSCI